MAKCRYYWTVPTFLPIRSPSGKVTQSSSLCFVEVPCNRLDGHKGHCKPKGVRSEEAPAKPPVTKPKGGSKGARSNVGSGTSTRTRKPRPPVS